VVGRSVEIMLGDGVALVGNSVVRALGDGVILVDNDVGCGDISAVDGTGVSVIILYALNP